MPRSQQWRAIIRQSEPVVSAQIINEVCVNLLKTNAVSEEQISQLIESFYQKYRIVELSKAALLSASRLRQRYSLSFWDSIVVACALEAGVSVLYSEDMQHGLVFEQQLQVVNPFVHP